MIVEKGKMLGLLALTTCCFGGCREYREPGDDRMIESNQTSLHLTETQSVDAITLTKFNYQIEGGDFEKAKVHAGELSTPDAKAIAFLRIVLEGKETIDTSVYKKEALNHAIQNLNSISDLEVKFALQQEFLTALLHLDPKHKQKHLNEIYLSILDNFWETSTALDTHAIQLTAKSVAAINMSLNKSWNLEMSQLKKLGLEGKIHTAKLRYALHPEKSKTEISTIKNQVWEINPPLNRVPLLLDLIEFELDVTHDIAEAMRLIKTLKKTIELE